MPKTHRGTTVYGNQECLIILGFRVLMISVFFYIQMYGKQLLILKRQPFRDLLQLLASGILETPN